MINISRFFLWLCLTFVVSNCQQFLPFGSFQHDIAFPSINGEFHSSSVSDQHQPIRQVSGGFHLNPPPPLPFLQSFPINPQFFSAARDSFRRENFPHGRFFGGLLTNLFTPNTVRQRPESDAQDEAYRNYLKEEAEEFDKEKLENDITTDFTDFNIDSTSLQPSQKAFVKVNIQGKDYSYST